MRIIKRGKKYIFYLFSFIIYVRLIVFLLFLFQYISLTFSSFEDHFLLVLLSCLIRINKAPTTELPKQSGASLKAGLNEPLWFCWFLDYCRCYCRCYCRRYCR